MRSSLAPAGGALVAAGFFAAPLPVGITSDAEILQLLVRGREAAFLRQIEVRPGSLAGVDTLIALFSTSCDEPLDEAPARAGPAASRGRSR